VKATLRTIATGGLAAWALGCGLGPGRAPSSVQLLVTRDFGAQALGLERAPHVAGQETVMGLLLRNHHVDTRYGGAFVQAIDGLGGGQEGGHPVDWFYYVNGVEAPKGAAATNVNAGDRIWWDHHDWSVTNDVPAVVGSFPEPFLDGVEGKRLPVRIECAEVEGFPCHAVVERLRALGVPAAIAGLGSAGEIASIRVLVAPWSKIAGDPTAGSISRGPRASGVYATFSRDGASLTLLDEDGAPVRTLGAGAGLIAAAKQGDYAPVWVVTGTDAAGVQDAAADFAAGQLDQRFAIAVTGGQSIALPEVRR
jgi:Domain of unknown function (DUF4430)